MDQIPGDRPPASRRLERPPSERYAPAGETSARGAAAAEPTGSVERSIAFAIPAAVIGLAVYLGFAGPLAFSSGLVVVAIFAGRTIGLAARAGAGRTVPSDQRMRVAVAIALAWFVLAHVAVWLYARNEGGVLPILDYLLETFGLIVPLSGIAAVLAAWWSAR
jgi:hypothetical protein